MLKEVKADIITVLRQAYDAIREENSSKVKELSDHTIRNAGIFQDKDSLSVAVLIYSLSKLMDRCCDKILVIGDKIPKLVLALQGSNYKGFRYQLKHIFRSISRNDEKLGLYIEKVINQANIKKGTRLFEHGFSVGKAADMLGITQWELQNYIGKTKIPEQTYGPLGVEKRLRLARRIFGV